jgi:hypothetical protein
MKNSILILALLLLTPVIAVRAQNTERCATNRNAPPVGAYAWPPDSEVKVYFTRKMFTPEQKETLLVAMESWTQSARQTGAGVRFIYSGDTEGLKDCKSCLTLTRQEVFKNDGGKHYAFFYPMRRAANGCLVSAWIDFDFATTHPQALQGFMAHELGHGMGLGDCTTCKKKQTIMNAFPGINQDNGLIEPSACDLEVVRQVYQLQHRVAGNTNEAGAISKRN